MDPAKLYYTPPSDFAFMEVKVCALSLWTQIAHDDEHYLKEKTGAIKDIANIKDNFMYMVAMFDIHNQRRLADMLTSETRKAVRDRLVDGGAPEWSIVF